MAGPNTASMTVRVHAQARTQHAVALELASQIGHKHEQARAHNRLDHASQAVGDQNQAASTGNRLSASSST
jgi:hypothetical protein